MYTDRPKWHSIISVVVVITAANTHDMKKAATETLDRTVVKRPSCKQNLCLDKAYDVPEIQRESIKRKYIPRIFVTEVKKKKDY